MIRYTVTWVQSAEDELAEIWLASAERNTISQAADLLDHELKFDAATRGAELAEGLRWIAVPPTRVIFAADEQDRIVEVLRVSLV